MNIRVVGVVWEGENRYGKRRDRCSDLWWSKGWEECGGLVQSVSMEKEKKKQRKKEDNVITSLNCLVLDFPPPKPTYLFTWKSITRAVWLFFCKYLFLKTVLIWFLQQNLDENRENLNFPCKKKWILKKTERIEGEGGKGWQGLLRC